MEEEQGIVVRVLNYGLVAAVTGLLLGTYPVLLALFCFPLLAYSVAWGVVVTVVYHLLLLLTLISYYRTVFTNTSVPSTFSHADTIESGEGTSLERKKKSAAEFRVCSKCRDQDKPDRAHHCRHCGKCVLKMDHHCPWVNNCVGWRNYKFFMLFITYTPILCLFMITNLVLVAILTWSWGDLGWEEIVLLALGALGGVFFVTLVGFAGMHYRLIIANMTTIESMENIYSSTVSPYDVGAYRNFCQVFGTNPILWFFPWANMNGNGVTFPANKRLLPHVEPTVGSGAPLHDNSLVMDEENEVEAAADGLADEEEL